MPDFIVGFFFIASISIDAKIFVMIKDISSSDDV